MAVEIAVCYSNIEVVRLPWAQRDRLALDGVLSLAVICPGDPQGECRSIYHDFYQLVWDDSHFCLTGHDGDYGFYSFTEPDVVEWRFPFDLRENSLEFIGAYADTDELWQKALDIYGDRSGPMY